eukprot:10418537-Ditylum_brightwellii.AAC.1
MRTRHQNMKNQSREPQKFDYVNLVIVCKQVKSRATEGFSAELAIRGRGLCKVLREADNNLYWIQRLLFAAGTGRAGIEIKENVA